MPDTRTPEGLQRLPQHNKRCPFCGNFPVLHMPPDPRGVRCASGKRCPMYGRPVKETMWNAPRTGIDEAVAAQILQALDLPVTNTSLNKLRSIKG